MRRCDHCGKRFLPHHGHYTFVKDGKTYVIHQRCKDKLFDKHLKKRNGHHLK